MRSPGAVGATFLAVIGLLAAPPARAELGLDTLETEDLTLVYRDPLQAYLVPHAARCFENALAFHERLFGYAPSEPMTVLLNDFSDAGNASAGAIPHNLLMLETSPLGSTYETVSSNERMNWLMNHELVHVVTSDQAARADRIARRLFRGKVAPDADDPESILWYYLTTPRDAAPRWYHEGLAVFLETWMAGGIGRAQGAWDEMVFRAMVRDGAPFHDPLGLVSEGTRIDFQVEVNAYLYGTRFLSYLGWRWSPEHVVRWATRAEGGKRYFAGRFREVFGEPLSEAWAEWVDWERSFQRANLEAIRTYPVTPVRDLSPRALGSISRPVLDRERGTIYAGLNYPGTVSHLGAISLGDGSVRRVADIDGPLLFTVTSLAWDPSRRRLLYTTDNRGYRDLREIDPDTGQGRTLLVDARIGDLAFDRTDGALWGVRHFNGIASVVRVPPPYTSWTRVHTFPYGEVPYDLDVSPDGAVLSASVGQVDGRHDLRLFSTERLRADDATPLDTVTLGDAVPMNFTFSPDGRYLYGSASYTGVANVYRYEVATRRLEAVSNAETGFFRPVVLEGDTLVVFRYTGQGFVPATIEALPLEDLRPITFLGAEIAVKHPVVRDWKLGSPAAIDLDARVRGQSPYRSGRRLQLESVYPVVQGYRDTGAVGARVNLSDPLLLQRASFVASYSPDRDLPSDERVHLDLKWRRYDWRAGATLNRADFYDLFGPTKTSRKGHSVGVGWGRALLYDPPRTLRLDVDGAWFGDLDTLPAYQNVAAPTTRLGMAEVRLQYANARASLGHVDDEKGLRWELLAGGDRAGGSTFPRLVGGVDVGVALPLPHSSVWLRTAAGAAGGDRDNPLGAVYLGGFGNNWVDHRAIKRYRDVTSFPGAEINEIAARTFGRALLEWNLPPVRFRRAGTPAFYASWLRPAVFATGLLADPPAVPPGGDPAADERRELGNVGAQVDLRLTVLSRLDLTVSVGWARLFETQRGPRGEWMASLKVLE